MLVLSSNMIFSGNSGGPILDSTGRLIGIVFCTLKVDESRVINQITLSVNLGMLSKLVWLLLKENSRSFDYGREIDKNQILSIKDKVIDNASEFYF